MVIIDKKNKDFASKEVIRILNTKFLLNTIQFLKVFPSSLMKIHEINELLEFLNHKNDKQF